ncbi:adenine phosphoribosyltransferase [Candidatus Woesearchaeota archaeon]|nr:adenine phosphoribosyltransferase [Candidatus Woesearchaeota archaeon]
MDSIKSHIRAIPDFPKKGIMFRDITTLLKDAAGFQLVIGQLASRYRGKDIDLVVGIESRGFILGGALAFALGKGFVPVRKSGKLPYDKISHEYELEYGTDKVEIHTDAIAPGSRVLMIDDVIATGGTMLAAIALVEKLGGIAEECAFIVDLPDIGGSKKLREKGHSVFSLCEFEGG